MNSRSIKKCLFISLLLLACEQTPQKKCLTLDKKKLVLTDSSVAEILLKRKKIDQRLIITDDGMNKIENYFSSPKIKRHLNTWITIYKTGSVNYEESNYLDHYFSSRDKNAYLTLKFRTANDPDGKFYLLYSDYDTNFVSHNNVVDTIFFDVYGEAEIKLMKVHKGSNIVRAIIIKENKKKNKNITYFEKDLFVDYE